MWKKIKGYKGYYSVNDNCDIRNNKTGKLIIGDINNSGYYRVFLIRNYLKKKSNEYINKGIKKIEYL